MASSLRSYPLKSPVPFFRGASLFSVFLAAFFAALLSSVVWALPTEPFTAVFLSDTHFGKNIKKVAAPDLGENRGMQNRLRLDEILQRYQIPGDVSAAFHLEMLPSPPLGLFFCGDLTDGSTSVEIQKTQWELFSEMYPEEGIEFPGGVAPVFLGFGNHDGATDGVVRKRMRGRVKGLKEAGRLSSVSSNGLHYAVQREGIHFIQLNLVPADEVDLEKPFRFGKAGAGSFQDPEGALSFLRQYLSTQVSADRDVIFLIHHYGFDPFSTNDWNWWTPTQRDAYRSALCGYRVGAIVHGHDHRADAYRWPSPKEPAGPENFQILDCGQPGWFLDLDAHGYQAFHPAAHAKSPAFYVARRWQEITKTL